MQLTQIIDLIADHCVLDANDLNADTLLSDHLDSLDLSEVAAAIEHRACIDISDADLATCRTIGDLHKLVSQDDDLDEPLPQRTASCDGDTCESCQ